MRTPWLDIAKQWGLVAGRGIPTPDVFRELGLPITNLHFTRTSDVKVFGRCPMEYRYSIMEAKVPAGPDPAWKTVGTAFHKVFTEFAKTDDVLATSDLIEATCVELLERARVHPSPYQTKTLEEAALTLEQLAPMFGDPMVIPDKLGLKRVLTAEEPMWLWIPAWAIGVANGDSKAIAYAQKAHEDPLVKQPRPMYGGVFGVVLMFQVDVIGVNHDDTTTCVQIKTHSGDDLEVLCNELSFGLHEMVYDIGAALVARDERWPELVESTLIAVDKTPRKLDKIEPLKTITDAIADGKIEADGPDLYRVNCTDKQWEKFTGMWARYQENLRAAKQDYDTWPSRAVRFMQLDQRFDRQPMMFAAMLYRLGQILTAEGRPDLLHLTPHNEASCRGRYNQPCVYRHAKYCGANDDLTGMDWQFSPVDYVNQAAAEFRRAQGE